MVYCGSTAYADRLLQVLKKSMSDPIKEMQRNWNLEIHGLAD